MSNTKPENENLAINEADGDVQALSNAAEAAESEGFETKKQKRLRAKAASGSEAGIKAQKPSVSAAIPPKGMAKTAGKNAKTKKPRKNIFKSIGKGIKGIISELKKVTWPKTKTVFSSTGVVLVVVLIFLVVVFAFDYVLSGLLSLLLGNGWVNLFS